MQINDNYVSMHISATTFICHSFIHLRWFRENCVFFPRIFIIFIPTPREHLATICRSEDDQPITVIVQLYSGLRTSEISCSIVYIGAEDGLQWIGKKHNFSRTLYSTRPMSQVGWVGRSTFLRCSATATTSAASNTTATAGPSRAMPRIKPSTAGPEPEKKVDEGCDKQVLLTGWVTIPKSSVIHFQQ